MKRHAPAASFEAWHVAHFDVPFEKFADTVTAEVALTAYQKRRALYEHYLAARRNHSDHGASHGR